MLGKIMREETPANLCDSGAVYGRAYEARRRIKSYRNYPRVFFVADAFTDGRPATIKSAFHYLAEHTTYDADATRRLHEFLEQNPKATEDDFLDAEGGIDVEGFPPTECETFDDNFFCLLYEDEDCASKAIITVHGGSDMRYGWTKMRVFTVNDRDAFVVDASAFDASCACGSVGTFDGGETWFLNNPECSVFDNDGWPDTWKMVTPRKCVCVRCGEHVVPSWDTR